MTLRQWEACWVLVLCGTAAIAWYLLQNATRGLK